MTVTTTNQFFAEWQSYFDGPGTLTSEFLTNAQTYQSQPPADGGIVSTDDFLAGAQSYLNGQGAVE